ncbi:MAG TPA: SDR family NAD(P)-dependent oxidoreductase [Flavisolibacter sp.]
MKKVIIIGATSGIGRALAVIYVSMGWRVGATGRRSELLETLRQEAPAQIETACFNVMHDRNHHHLEQLISALGGMDLLIYNSGIGEVSKELDHAIETTTIRTNVNGFVDIVAYAFNFFVRQGHGQIALTSSVAGLRGNSWAPAYSASKAFMSNYAEGLNIKSARMKKDVVVTDLRPGFVKTKMAQGKQFWSAPVDKAAQQIVKAISHRRRVAYITRRWWLVAQLMKILPYRLYASVG